jgi:hypothetical protein
VLEAVAVGAEKVGVGRFGLEHTVAVGAEAHRRRRREEREEELHDPSA